MEICPNNKPCNHYDRRAYYFIPKHHRCQRQMAGWIYQPVPFLAFPSFICPSAVALLMIADILLPALSFPLAMYLPDFISITGSIIGTFLVFVFTEYAVIPLPVVAMISCFNFLS